MPRRPWSPACRDTRDPAAFRYGGVPTTPRAAFLARVRTRGSHPHRAGGLESRALRLPGKRGRAADRQPQPVAAVAAQHAARAVRGGARRLPGARPRHRQHDAHRRRHRRHRRRHADLDRGRARRDGALFRASRPAPGHRRDLHPHPHRPLGRRARRARRCDAWRPVRVPVIAPNLFMEHAVSENVIAGSGDAAARAISVRSAAGEGAARSRRLRPRQDHGGGRALRCCGRPT